MRIKTVLFGALGAGLIVLSYAAAQQPAAPRAVPGQPRTLEERVTALERSVASLATRFEARDAALNRGGSDALGASSLLQLQNEVMRLANDLQRVERQADAAARDASDARREAQDAQRAARDAALRTR